MSSEAVNEKREGCECPTHYENGRKVSKNDRCHGRWIRCVGAAEVLRLKRLEEAKALVAAAGK